MSPNSSRPNCLFNINVGVTTLCYHPLVTLLGSKNPYFSRLPGVKKGVTTFSDS